MPHNVVLWEVNGDQGMTVIQRFSFSQDREERPLDRHSTQVEIRLFNEKRKLSGFPERAVDERQVQRPWHMDLIGMERKQRG